MSNEEKCFFYENGKCLACKRYYEMQVCPNCMEVSGCYYKKWQESIAVIEVQDTKIEDYEKKVASLSADNSLYDECISTIEDYFDLEPAPALRLTTLLEYMRKVSNQIKGNADG